VKTWTVTAIALVVWLVTVSPAAAQTDLKIPTIAWTAAAGADWATTYQFSSKYGDVLHERNPLINGLDQHPAWLVTAGAAMDAGMWVAANRFLGDRHPRWMKVALYGAAVYRVYLAAYNIRMMQQAQSIIAARPLRN